MWGSRPAPQRCSLYSLTLSSSACTRLSPLSVTEHPVLLYFTEIAGSIHSEKIQFQRVTILKVAPIHGGEEALRSSPLKDSARRMNGFWLDTTEHMLGRSKMTPRLMPCDSGSPRKRPPRPGSGLQLTIGSSAGGSPLLRAETRSSHSCGQGLWISSKKVRSEELYGPGERARRGQPPVSLVNLTRETGLGLL